MIAIRPVMKAEIPEANPASIVRAKAGLPEISAIIEFPEDTPSYKVSVNDMPMNNSSGIAIISPNDHFPILDFGITPPRCYNSIHVISFRLKLYNRYVIHPITILDKVLLAKHILSQKKG